MITLSIKKWILLTVMAVMLSIILPIWKTKLSIVILMSPLTRNDFELFYKDSTTLLFTGTKMIKGSTSRINRELAIIDFEIPDSVILSSIRIDLGVTQNIQYIKEISLVGFWNKFVWTPKKIMAEFRPINVKILEDGGQLKMMPITNDPYLISKKDLDSLAKRIRYKSELFSNSYFLFIVIVAGFLIVLWLAKFVQYYIRKLSNYIIDL